MGISAALLAAYRATRYVARTSRGRIVLRVGERSPDADALLDEHGLATWAFVTAWNPRSVPCTEVENRERLAALEATLRERGYAFHPGDGEPADDRWAPEPSFLVLGIAREAAVALGRAFEQNAIVFGRRDAPAELIDCFPEARSD